jgi:hypothetical protein
MDHLSARPRPPLLRRRSIVFAVTLAMIMTVSPAVGAVALEPAAPEVVTDEVAGFRTSETNAGWSVSEVAEAPMAFTMVGFNHPDGIDVDVRTSVDGDGWTEWLTAEAMGAEDGPDMGVAEDDVAEHVGERVHTEPLWTGEALYLQLRAPEGALEDLNANVIDSNGVSRSLFERVRDSLRPGVVVQSAEAASLVPRITTRAEWEADESWRKTAPGYASNVRNTIVHHTAGGNTYTRAESPAVVRGIYSYHARTLGWNDVGYNFLIDRYGRIYEGRFGGVHRGVIGAHAQGFNTGTFGVAIMGNFQNVLPPAEAQESLARTVAWKFAVHGIAANTSITVTSAGSNKYSSGTAVRLNTIAGHRDVGLTACPGNLFYGRMDAMRNRVQQLVPLYGAFPDLDRGTYFFEAANWMAANGISDGYGTTGRFEPSLDVTRGQMAAFLWRLMDEPTGYPHHGFPDVSSSAYYNDAVRWLRATEVTDGFGSTGRFEPDRPVTRGEMASFLWRAVNRPLGDPSHRFPDVSTSDHYNQAVSWMRAHDITNGFGTTGHYEPGRRVSRAEVSAMMYRLASSKDAWSAVRRPPSAVNF